MPLVEEALFDGAPVAHIVLFNQRLNGSQAKRGIRLIPRFDRRSHERIKS